MTQYDFGVLEITHTGAALATKLNGVVSALMTQHRGPARPAYVQPGMLWIDDSGSLWLLNLFDGTGDIAIAAVDPDTHAVVTHFVPETRKLRGGKGLKLNGVAGTDAVPAEADLAADLLFGFDLSAFAALQALWNAGADEGLHPISPAQLKAAIAALGSSGVFLNMQVLTYTQVYTPTVGTTKARVRMVGGGGGASGQYGSPGEYREFCWLNPSTKTITVGAGSFSGAGGDTVIPGVATAGGGSVGAGANISNTGSFTGVSGFAVPYSSNGYAIYAPFGSWRNGAAALTGYGMGGPNVQGTSGIVIIEEYK